MAKYWVLVADYDYGHIGLCGITSCEETAQKFEAQNPCENRAIETPLSTLDSVPPEGSYIS